ncbi:MAG TPA: hypothetical protein VF221_07505 [Chloroflexota bacterium]
MPRTRQQQRAPLARQLFAVVFAFLAGQLVTTHVFIGKLGFWPHVLIFLVVYAVIYILLWRLTEGLWARPGAPPR